MDSTGAPALPAGLTGAGNTYVITPHGGDFAQPVEVRIPAPAVTLLPTQELKLAKAQPGGEWELLDSAVSQGMLSAKVTSFSYFISVIVNYPLPILQFEPFSVTTKLDCGDQPCDKVVGPVTATFSVTSNNGQLPTGCLDEQLYVKHGADAVGNITGLDAFLYPDAPIARNGSMTLSLVPRNFFYTFAPGLKCFGSTSFRPIGWRLTKSVEWIRPPAYPRILVVRMPSQLDVVEGMPATLDAILQGGANKKPGVDFLQSQHDVDRRRQRHHRMAAKRRQRRFLARDRTLLRVRRQSSALRRPASPGVRTGSSPRIHRDLRGSGRADPSQSLLHAARRRGIALRHQRGDSHQRAAAERAARHRERAAIGAGPHRADRELSATAAALPHPRCNGRRAPPTRAQAGVMSPPASGRPPLTTPPPRLRLPTMAFNTASSPPTQWAALRAPRSTLSVSDLDVAPNDHHSAREPERHFGQRCRIRRRCPRHRSVELSMELQRREHPGRQQSGPAPLGSNERECGWLQRHRQQQCR